MTEKMTPVEKAHERGYIEGRRRTLINQLTKALGDLGALPRGDSNLDLDVALTKLALVVSEREETIATLRGLCRDYGDNSWEDSLHLQDIIESHLVKHLLHGKGKP